MTGPALVAASAAAIAGIVSVPLILLQPAPIVLCTFRPPFECVSGPMTGSQYALNEVPTALAWLMTSLVLAPLASLAGAILVRVQRRFAGKALACLALLPVLLHFAGTYALIPFHLLVAGMTMLAFLFLLRDGDPALTRTTQRTKRAGS